MMGHRRYREIFRGDGAFGITLRVISIVILMFGIRSSLAQVASGLTEANACRHVAILARENDKSNNTARCHISTKVIDKQAPLFDIVDEEWSWIYKNIRSVTGQVLSRETRKRKLFTQIECIDPGNAVGRWARTYYGTPGNGSFPKGVIQYLGPSGSGDAYRSCVTAKPDSKDIVRYPDSNDSLSVKGLGKLKKYVRVHGGQHFGIGDEIKEFEFSYSWEELRTTIFRDFDATIKVSEDHQGEKVREGKLMEVNGFPYESGLSIMASSKGLKPRLTNITTDLSVLGWNRLLEAELALAGRRNPPVDKAPEVDAPQSLLNVLVSLLAIVTLRQTWRSVQEKRQERAREWANLEWDGDVGDPVLICRRDEQRKSSSYLVATSSEALTIAGLIASAIIAILLSGATFWNSNLIDRDLVVVSQGGVITYEGRVGRLREKPDNPVAGALFVVGHWMTIELEKSGHVAWRLIIVLGHVLLALWVWDSISFLANSLEHKYDSYILQSITKPVRWIHRASRSCITRIMPIFQKRWKTATYCKTYRSLCERLPYSTGLKINILENSQYDAWGLGRLKPPPRNCREKELLEKCAVVMADYRWGMLDFPQALYIHTDLIAITALNRWTSSGVMPDYREALHIATAHFVTGVITTTSAGGGETLVGESESVFIQESAQDQSETNQSEKDGFLALDFRGANASLRSVLDSKGNKLAVRNRRAFEIHLNGQLPKWLLRDRGEQVEV